ncbi:hypothetical protein D3C75_472060 [compost metagenome]
MLAGTGVAVGVALVVGNASVDAGDGVALGTSVLADASGSTEGWVSTPVIGEAVTAVGDGEALGAAVETDAGEALDVAAATVDEALVLTTVPLTVSADAANAGTAEAT